jgi:hypothetical protein
MSVYKVAIQDAHSNAKQVCSNCADILSASMISIKYDLLYSTIAILFRLKISQLFAFNFVKNLVFYFFILLAYDFHIFFYQCRPDSFQVGFLGSMII